MSIPRIITVDPTWTLARVIRAATDLLDRPVIQVDVPSGADALAEIGRGCTLLITNFEVDSDMKGFELAMRVRRDSPDTAVIILGEEGDPPEFDQETASESPYVYLCRPMDLQKFLRVLIAGLDGGDVIEALFPPTLSAPVINTEMGPVPNLDLAAAQGIVDSLRSDLAAMSIILSTRTGEVLLERGAVGLMNRDKLTTALLPGVLTGIDVKELVGGQIASVQYYDGEQYDLFVLTVGLHHFLCVIFDGQQGSRQFGAVNRFGRRAVEELIAKIGAAAFFIQPKVIAPPVEDTRAARKKAGKTQPLEEDIVTLERADLGLGSPAAVALPEPETLHLEPITDADFNLDDLFGSQLDDLTEDDLFALDELENLASQNMQNTKGKLGWEQAREIGIMKE